MKKAFKRIFGLGIVGVVVTAFLFGLAVFAVPDGGSGILPGQQEEIVAHAESNIDYTAPTAVVTASVSSYSTSATKLTLSGTTSVDTGEKKVTSETSPYYVSTTANMTVKVTFSGDLATAISNGRLKASLTLKGSFLAHGYHASNAKIGNSKAYFYIGASGGLTLSNQYKRNVPETTSTAANHSEENFTQTISSATLTGNTVTFTLKSYGYGFVDHNLILAKRDAKAHAKISISELTVTMSMNKPTATFSAGTGGGISFSSKTLDFYDTASSKATANAGYYFTKWTSGTTDPTKTTVAGFEMKENFSDTANFKSITAVGKTAIYSPGVEQTVTAPTLESGFVSKITYKGTTNAGTTYSENTKGPTEAGTYTVTISVYRTSVSDANYRGKKEVTLTINRATPKRVESSLSASEIIYGQSLSASALTVTYVNPENSTLNVVGKTPNEVAWSNPSVIPTRVPEYTATYTFYPQDTANYVESVTGTVVITVNRKLAQLQWTEVGWYDYNGELQSPTASVLNLVTRDGKLDECEVELSGRQRDVRTDCIVTAVGLSNENYCLPENHTPENRLFLYYTIRAINMDARELQIDRDTWIWDYDGNTYTVTANAELKYGDAATVTYYVDEVESVNTQFKDVKWNDKNKVDFFTVRAVLTHKNYFDLEISARTVQINCAEMEGFLFEDIGKTYDGQPVSPLLKSSNSGEAEVQNRTTQYGDVVTAVYAIDGDTDKTSVVDVKYNRGSGVVEYYEATVTLTHPNYFTKTLTAGITVNKRSVALTYEEVEVEYGNVPVLVPVIEGMVEGETLIFGNGYTNPSAYPVKDGSYPIYPSVMSADNPNYIVITAPGKMTVVPREITVQTVDFETIYGDVPEKSAYSYITYQTGDKNGVGVLDGDSIYVEPVYTRWEDYPVGGKNRIFYQLTANKTNANYHIAFASGALNVLPRPVTVKALNAEIVYGDTPDTSKYTERRTVGEGAGVMPGDSLILSGESATLYPVVRLAGGGYGSHEYTFSAAEGANPNYDISFESGYITVTPRTVKVTVKDATVKYGLAIPSFEIAYANFAPGESVNTDGITPAVAVCDAVRFSDVNAYVVSLTSASANNYEFDCTATAILTIEAVKVPTLNYAVKPIDYNGRAYAFEDTLLTLTGLSGGSEPKAGKAGVGVAYRLGENEFSAVAPKNAGEYEVRLLYTPVEGDNYALTEHIIETRLVINKIDPEIEITENRVNYTAYTAKGMKAVLTVGADCNAPQNEGKVIFEYYYDNDWQATAPVNAGDYLVRATYRPDGNGNYKQVAAEKMALHIDPVDVCISLAYKKVEYCSQEFSANTATVEGVGQDKVSQEVRYDYNGTPLSVGEYDVTVTWESNDPNYNTTRYFLKGAVKVKRNTKDLTFSILENFVKNYDGISVGNSVVNARINVPNGWETYTGRIECKFSRNGGAAVDSVKDAGTYTVVATYIPGKDDQYEEKTMIYSEGTVTINPVPVVFNWTKHTYAYNAKAQSAKVTVSGVDGGSDPQGTVTIEYKQKDGTYSTVAPVNAGNYSLRLTYMPNEYKQDNYAKTIRLLSDSFIIEKAAPSISIRYFAEEFSGDDVAFPRENVTISGIAGDVTPTGRVIIRYLYDNAWQSIPPYKSGTYDVRVLYYAEDSNGVEGNYSGTDKVFPGGLTILNIAPTIELDPKTALYTGEAVTANTPRINTDEYDGTLSVEYLIGSYWSSVAPTEAGSYDVRVTYRAAEKDSYRSASRVIDRALIIQEVKLIVVPFAGQFKEYDGNPHDFIGYTLKNSDGKDIGLLEDGIITGALSAGSNPNAGRYPISIGDLSAGRNYVLTMAEETEYYSIEQKTVVVNFGDVNPMYDGTDKTVEASISGLLDGDSVALQIVYVGDRRNVGTFKARAIMESYNYVLMGGVKEFTIAPALITGISMLDVVATYDGKPHSVVPTGTEGCELTYETANSYTEVGGYVVRIRVEKPNHVTRTLEATVTILKGRQTVNVKAPEGKLQYGDELPKLDAGSDGVATLDQGQELKPGTFTYAYTYIPNDVAHYEIQKGFIELTAEKKTPNLGVEGSLVQWAQNPNKLNGTVDIPMENVEIYYESEDGSRFSQMPTEEGKYRVVVSYKGNDLYEAGEYVTTLVIRKPINYNWIFIVGGVLIALALIAVVVVAAKRANEAK